jgi:hypothetical protein
MTGIELLTLPAAIGGGSITTGTVLTGLSAAVGALGAISSGRQQAAANRYNAQVAEQNAERAVLTSEAEAAREGDRNRRRLATSANAFGASGLDMTGTPLDVMADLASEAALDEQIIRWRGRTQAARFQSQAAQDRAAAQRATTAGFGQAGATLLTAGARLGAGLGGGGKAPGGMFNGGTYTNPLTGLRVGGV